MVGNDGRIIVLMVDGGIEGVFESKKLAKQHMEKYGLSHKNCEWHEPYFHRDSVDSVEGGDCSVYIEREDCKKTLREGTYSQEKSKLTITFGKYHMEIFLKPKKPIKESGKERRK